MTSITAAVCSQCFIFLICSNWWLCGWPAACLSAQIWSRGVPRDSSFVLFCAVVRLRSDIEGLFYPSDNFLSFENPFKAVDPLQLSTDTRNKHSEVFHYGKIINSTRKAWWSSVAVTDVCFIPLTTEQFGHNWSFTIYFTWKKWNIFSKRINFMCNNLHHQCLFILFLGFNRDSYEKAVLSWRT